jgi:hypothetical protein
VADWVAISSLATAGGTLALAGTTFLSVRSANRAARVAELSLLAALRPLLVQSSPDDPPVRAGFYDGVTVTAPPESAGIEIVDGRIYIVVSLRNVGPGIAVLHGGVVYPDRRRGADDHTPLDDFHLLTRDIYIPPGKTGFWQIALRDYTPEREAMRSAIEGDGFGLEILYGDYEGGQRVISRFGVVRDGDGWTLSAVRHWQLDRAAPR